MPPDLRWRAAAIVVLALAWPAAAARGADAPAPPAAEIARLIEQLGSKEFDKRDEASKKLAAIGPPALEALTAAARDSADPEIRSRAVRLVEAMRLAAARAAEVRRFEGHTGRVTHVAISPNGKVLLTAGSDMTVRLWDVATGKEVRQLAGGKLTRDVAFSPDGKRVAVAGSDKFVRLFDPATGKEQLSFATPLLTPGLAFAPDGKRLVTAYNKYVIVWDAATGEEVRRLEDEGVTAIRSVAFSPDGKQLVTGGAGAKSRLALWDVETGKALRTIAGGGSVLYGVRYTPDGKHLVAAAGTRPEVAVFDAKTLKEVRKFDRHADAVYAAAVSPDGKRALSAGGRVAASAVAGAKDYSVRLWDIETGKELQRFDGHTNSVHGLVFTPDGKHAISGSNDGTVRMWKLMK
jgi:WD40 repeat protein